MKMMNLICVMACTVCLQFCWGCANPSSPETVAPTYAVSYNGNGNTAGTAPIDSKRYEAGNAITVAAPGSLSKSGYAFSGWNTNPSGTGTSYAASSTLTMGNANVFLYAVWKIIPTNTIPHTVTYMGNGNTGGDAPVDTVKYETGAAVAVAAPGTLEKNGYAFAGWNTLADGTGTSYSASETFIMGGADVVLYAKWVNGIRPSYTVSFDSNGGTAVPAVSGVFNGVLVPKPTSPTKDSNTFLGWYKDEECVTAWDFYTDTPTANITLYAKWYVLGPGDEDPLFTSCEGKILAVQADGKILTYKNALYRRNADGTRDTTFQDVQLPESVSEITVLSNGQIMVSGLNYIKRFSSDWVEDTSFSCTSMGTISKIRQQADGKYLLGGSFLAINGTEQFGLARINTDGSLDTSVSGLAYSDMAVTAIELFPDNSFLIGISVSLNVQPIKNAINQLLRKSSFLYSFDNN